MAIKYVREDLRGSPVDGRYGPIRFRGLTVRGRFLLLYTGILIFTAVLVFSQIAVPWMQFGGQPIETGSAVVLDMMERPGEPEEARYGVDVEVARPGGLVMRGHLTLPMDQWRSLVVGDRIVVQFQMSRWGERLKVLEVEGVAER